MTIMTIFKIVYFIIKLIIFICIGYVGVVILGLIYLALSSILEFISNVKSKIKSKIKRRIDKIKDKRKQKVFTYSVEESKKYGFNLEKETPKFKRPLIDDYEKSWWDSVVTDASKKNDKRFIKAIESWISLSELYKRKNIKNKTVGGFVDKIVEDEITLINRKAKYIIKADNLYDTKKGYDNIYSIAGNFVYINLTKKGDKIKINYILIDY